MSISAEDGASGIHKAPLAVPSDPIGRVSVARYPDVIRARILNSY